MEHFDIKKTNKKCKVEDKIKTSNGYKFKHKINITIYHSGLIDNILTKKIDNSLRKIINMYELLDDDDSDGVNELRIKIETLRTLLLGTYYKYINKKKVKAYLIKLDSIDNKVKGKNTKRRSR